eukprot:7773394-Ditylum_brightwellii.AAC.1
MPTTIDARFASWLEVLLHHPSVTQFDYHTRQTVQAIKHTNNVMTTTELLKETQANLVFLTTAPGVKHQCLLYHHLEEFGLTILDQPAGHYVLLGLGNTVHAVSVDTMVLFDVKDKRVPGLVYLQDLDTKDKVNSNPPTTGPNTVPQSEEALHNTILLAP